MNPAKFSFSLITKFIFKIYPCAVLLLLILFLSSLSGVVEAQTGPKSGWANLGVTLFAYNPNGSTYVADGVLVNYANKFSNYVDDDDAIKLPGGAVSLAINRHDTMLVIERRHTVTQNDTIPLNIKTPSAGSSYILEVKSTNFQPGITGSVYDSYLGTSFPVNLQGIVDIHFTVSNSAGSNAANRFSINLTPTIVLPVTFTSIKAYQVENGINILWKVAGEYNVKEYTLQQSVDGLHFRDYTSLTALGNADQSEAYQVNDDNPSIGMNYFRIKRIDLDGHVSYTQVVNVMAQNKLREIMSVFASANHLNLFYSNQPGGNHAVRITNTLGQLMFATQFNLQPGDGNYPISITNQLPHGIYYITIKSASQTQTLSVLL